MLQSTAESFEAGGMVGAGSFVCLGCGYKVVLEALDDLPECPTCGGTDFHRASMFELDPELMDQPTTEGALAAPPREGSGWLSDARADLPDGGHFIAFRDAGEIHVLPLEQGWSRVGRSIAADIRLDDPTVSRRHALIVRTEDGRVRVLDDRSLNGVFVNGDRVEWSRLGDGDEIAVGRYRLYLLAGAAATSLR